LNSNAIVYGLVSTSCALAWKPARMAPPWRSQSSVPVKSSCAVHVNLGGRAVIPVGLRWGVGKQAAC